MWQKHSKYLLCLLAVGVLAVSFMAGCTSKLEGEITANQKPIVWFVNIPPVDARSSVNPIINWVGQDRDGQIDFFRYIVIREDVAAVAIGAAPGGSLSENDIRNYIDDHLGGVADSLWTVLWVLNQDENSEGGPQTSNIIPMSAEIDSPVLTFVAQLVFVQAFDEEGLGSDVAYRRFFRNDNPPDTRIIGFVEGVQFINAPVPGGANTGIRIRWGASDVLDYPTDPPPFEYEWKLFGPYDDDVFEDLLDSFLVPVFISNDARVFRFGQEMCDTVWIGGVIDSIDCHDPVLVVCDTTYVGGSEVIDCDTHLIDTISQSGIYGTLDTLFRILDEDFVSSPLFNKVADNSDDGLGGSWVTDTRDSLFNVYWNAPADTSVEYNFFFWIRSRDDARVPDLTPAWVDMRVIDPKHERDILVVNWALPDRFNRGFYDSLNTSWNNYIQNWIATRTDHIEYDPALDYIPVTLYASGTDQPKYLRFLLSHKIVINMQDVIANYKWGDDSFGLIQHTYTALQTGVNMWAATRTSIGNNQRYGSPATSTASNNFRYYFGTEEVRYDGWSSYAITWPTAWRIEDFIGGLSLDLSRWPNLNIDSSLLHRRYDWITPYHWFPDSIVVLNNRAAMPGNADQMPLGALPGVGWAVRSSDTEAMYLYKSLYGADHFLGKDFVFNGRPVAHRLNRGLFRTVHWLFTPMAFEETSMQVTVNNVLDWMWDGHNYDQTVQLGSAGKGSSLAKTTAAELKDQYWNAYFNADGDMEEFYRLLGEQR